MKAIGSAIWSATRTVGHGIWRFCSLIHNWDEIDETYPELHTGPDGQQLAAGNLAANLIGGNGTGAF